MLFSSDPVVSSSIFVGAEREENLIRNFPTRASLRCPKKFTGSIPAKDLCFTALKSQSKNLLIQFGS